MRSRTAAETIVGVASRPALPNDEAITRLYREQRYGLLQLAMLLTGDRGVAEDVVQDAFLGLQRRWAKLADPETAGGYLRRSVINASRSRHRRAAVARRHIRVAEPEAGAGADVTALLAEEHRMIVDAVRKLPARQREVLVLRYWLDLSENQIAAAMGISAGTVKSTASRALDSLQRQLEDDHER